MRTQSNMSRILNSCYLIYETGEVGMFLKSAIVKIFLQRPQVEWTAVVCLSQVAWDRRRTHPLWRELPSRDPSPHPMPAIAPVPSAWRLSSQTFKIIFLILLSKNLFFNIKDVKNYSLNFSVLDLVIILKSSQRNGLNRYAFCSKRTSGL